MHRRNLTFLFALLSIAVGVAQIISSYSVTAQGFDEPCHVAAGLEFLTQGKYQLDPVHPPLSRVAIALPLYLAGVKYPDFSPSDPGRLNYNVVGNRILFDDHHYVRNLTLARLGVLPAFVLSALVVFYWTRGLYGDLASVVAVAMFTSSPVILTFSSLAYTDMFAASTQCTACFVFALWMEKPSWNATALLGAAVGLALLAKFTTVLFLASAFLCMLLIYFWLRQERRFSWNCLRPLTRKALVAGIISFTMLWAGYGFSVGHVQQTMNLSPDNPPSFEHFPAALRNVAHKLIAENAVLPAPELLRGLATAWVLNKTAPMSYLLEQNKRGGW